MDAQNSSQNTLFSFLSKKIIFYHFLLKDVVCVCRWWMIESGPVLLYSDSYNLTMGRCCSKCNCQDWRTKIKVNGMCLFLIERGNFWKRFDFSMILNMRYFSNQTFWKNHNQWTSLQDPQNETLTLTTGCPRKS